MEKTAIVSVIFPANLIYLDSFLKSLLLQDEKHFDLLLVTDSLGDIEFTLESYRGSFGIILFPLSGSVASIRQQTFPWLVTLPYKNFIFIDSDDLMSPDRVSVCNHYLNHSSIVVNDLTPFYDESNIPSGGFWKERIANEKRVTYKDIYDYNFVGLGNTAVRKEVINTLKIPEFLKAVDWFVFFQWLQHQTAVFVHDGKVQYRQHERNLVGLKNITGERLIQVAEVKVSHYRALCMDFPHIKKALSKNEEILARLKADSDYCAIKADHLNAKQINYFWWEETEYLNE